MCRCGFFIVTTLIILLGGSQPGHGYPPTSDELFSFAINWGETGNKATQLLSLLEGDAPIATPTPSSTRTMTRTPTWTPSPTLTPTMGPVINSVSPGVVDIGDTVTITGSGFGNGTHVVDVGGAQVNGTGNDTMVKFTMPVVGGMTYDIHCIEVRVITASNATSTAGGVVYPSRVDQTDNASLVIEDARYVQSTRRFQLDVSIENHKIVNGKPYAMCSPVVILYNATAPVGTDNDSHNTFISSYPNYDYRSVDPVADSPGHRLETDDTTDPKTWIVAADNASTHAFSMAVMATQLARPTAAHAADIYTTTDIDPHPYGLAYDPTTNLLHVSGDTEGWIYGVDVDKVEEVVATILEPGKGPSYMDVSPAGSDPYYSSSGRLWFSWTHPELESSENVVGAFDPRNFVASSQIWNILKSYQALPTGLDFTEPRGLAYDAAWQVLYVATEDTVTGVYIGASPTGFQLTGFSDLQGLAVDPDNGALFAVNGGTDQVICYRGLWTASTSDDQTVVFGGYGSAAGKFNDPRGIEVDENGLVFVVDRGNDRVQVLNGRSTTLTWLMMFGGHQEAVSVKECNGPETICPQSPADGFNEPGDVESTDYKTVWVSDSDNWRVVQWEHDSFTEDLFPYGKTGEILIHSNP